MDKFLEKFNKEFPEPKIPSEGLHSTEDKADFADDHWEWQCKKQGALWAYKLLSEGKS